MNPATLKIKSHFWIDWAEIAIENEGVARHARHELYAKDSSEALRVEKHAMIAVSASAHALDVVYGELSGSIKERSGKRTALNYGASVLTCRPEERLPRCSEGEQHFQLYSD